ncbi:hypothetical protein CLOM_g12473, partial [Closterium sp. NIES-68]
LLDRCHLLIRLGSTEGVVLRASDSSHQNSFFTVYNFVTTRVLCFYQNSSEDFLSAFEHFCDHFRAPPRSPALFSYISSCSNNVFAREAFKKQKAALVTCKGGSQTQAIKRMLAGLPYSAQTYSPSPYFDQSLFHFDEKLISASDRHKPCVEHPIKFILRRRPNVLKFKINPGLESANPDARIKRVATYAFHPFLPFAISVQQTFMQPSVVNFHFRK